MFARRAASATTPCLRCQRHFLAAAFKACASVDRPLPLTRYEHTTAEHVDFDCSNAPDESPRPTVKNDHIFKSISPKGRLRRFNGKFSREKYAPIDAKTLGKKTEILMLRDEPEVIEEEPEQNRYRHDTENDITKTRPSTLTVADPPHEPSIEQGAGVSARDIESYTVKQSPPQPSEVAAAITERKPIEEVLTKKDFDAKVKNLSKSFSLRQLSHYLKVGLGNAIRRTHGRPSRSKGSHDPTSSGINQLKTIAWRADLSAPPNLSQDAPKHKGRRLKLSHAENVMRHVWNVRIEEEAAAAGKLDVLLTKSQWGLLHTREAPNLFSILRSRTFYRNSRLERDPDRGTLVVTGPKQEAEGIEQLIATEFAGAKSAILDLRPLSSVHLGGLFALREIREATKTYVVLQPHDFVEIFAFSQSALDDGVRHVTALLDRHLDDRWTALSPVDDRHCVKVPFHALSTLPLSGRRGNVYRRVTELLKDDDHRQGPCSGATDPSSDYYQKMLTALKSGTTTPGVSKTDSTQAQPTGASLKSYWSMTAVDAPWQATMGLSLRRETYRSKERLGQPRREEQTWSTFSPQMPNLEKILGQFNRAADAPIYLQELTVRLVPSPLEDPTGSRALLQYPSIEIVLSTRSSTAADSEPSTVPTWDLGNNTVMRLEGVYAIVHRHVVDFAFPDHVRDLQFTKRRLVAASPEIMHDDGFKAFIQGIVQSASDGTSKLSAMASLDVRLEPNMLRTKLDDSSADLTKVRYLFAGFEHRQVRRIVPVPDGPAAHVLHEDTVMEISEVEGGAIGGKRTEMVIAGRADRASTHDTTEQTLRSALATLEYADKVQ